MHLLWLALGLIGAIWIFWDTRNQGLALNASLRWAIGAFLVPAAVIPIYILQSNFRARQKPKKQKPQDITSEMYQSCRHCGEFYQGNPEKCPHCKKILMGD